MLTKVKIILNLPDISDSKKQRVCNSQYLIIIMRFLKLIKKPPGELDFFNVSFMHHNNESTTLIIYNNGKARKCQVSVTAIDFSGNEYTITYDELLARTSVPLCLKEVQTQQGAVFSFPVTRVIVKYAKSQVVFLPEGNHFDRIY